MIHLVLYHLMVTQDGRDGFFRWNEDICGCIQVPLHVALVAEFCALIDDVITEKLADSDASEKENSVVAQHRGWHSLRALPVSVPIWCVIISAENG